MIYVDATCPLVSKVHVEAQRHFANGDEIVLIGHAGHPENERADELAREGLAEAR